jgi:UDP-2,3-diacylglucosamine pyrophosphatase LpxH
VRIEVKTLVISDVHLGTKGSKAKELVRFLKQYKCSHLILNGDIVDGWQLKKSGKWKKKHTRFFKRLLTMMEDDGTRVHYLRGNHDDFLDQILPLHIGNLSIQKDLIYESFGKKFFITHGDIFDSITSKFGWIAKLGDIGYTFLLWCNARYNLYRRKNGLPYYSLSQVVKSKVKSAVSFIDDFEQTLSTIARDKGCDAVICGHIHTPAMKTINGIHYYNSGDWVETLSALVEDQEGNWNIVYYNESDILRMPLSNSSVSGKLIDEKTPEEVMEIFPRMVGFSSLK